MGKPQDLSLLPIGAVGSRFVVAPVENSEYRGNELFPAFESHHSPRVALLRERYGLDAVVAGESDEWRRILCLRHWIRTHIRIEDAHPTPAAPDAFAILDAALAGGGFHCAHFSIVQHAVLNSYGYVARRLGCGPGLAEKGGHHGVNEVWVNSLCKWVLIDAKYDLHFEKGGVPLSALEIRDEVWRDGARSVVRRFGLEGATSTEEYPGDFGPSAETYRWCSWELNTNRFTAYPAAQSSTLVMLDDEHFRASTWYRDGKPHWAYGTPYLITTPRRDWIEWTPNVLRVKAVAEGDQLAVSLASFTPNLRSHQVRRAGGPWQDCGEHVVLPLESPANRFAFRAANLFGVTGPEHRVDVAWA